MFPKKKSHYICTCKHKIYIGSSTIGSSTVGSSTTIGSSTVRSSTIGSSTVVQEGELQKNSGGKFNCWKLNFEIPLRLHVNVMDSLRLHVNVMDFKSVLRITCNIFHYAFPFSRKNSKF